MIRNFSQFHIATKLSMFFTILMFMAIPVTVLSVNTLRESESRAAGSLGDPNYPDPVVSWTKDPQYRIHLCLNTTDRSSNLCNREIYVSSGTSYTTNALDKFDYYYWVMIKDHSNNWVDYTSGKWYNSCFLLTGGSLCDHKISWNQPTFSAQATQRGSLTNACSGGISTCSSSKNTTYPSKSVQFVDLPVNINIDVYVKIGSITYTVLTNIPTGSTSVTSAPNLSVPKYGEVNVTTNNTPFAWSAVPGASYYALWVSTSPNFTTDGFWYKNVPSTACNSTSCVNTWNTIAWSTKNGDVGPFPPPPSSLAKGKTYYWSAWACSATDCPWVGLSKTWNFTTESAMAGPLQPAGLKDTDFQATIPPGVWGTTHKFEWTGASANLFAVDISSDPNFNGGFVNRVIDVVPATALTTYSVTGDTGWANQGTANYSSGGRLVLQENVKYYWRVYARNSAGTSVYSATKEVVKPPTVQPTSKPLQPSGLKDSDSLATMPSGTWGKTHIFEWVGANAIEFFVDISTDQNFVSGWVNKKIVANPAAALTNYKTTGTGGWANQGNANYASGGNLNLAENTIYYWRVYAWNGSGIHSATPNPKVNKPPTGSVTSKPTQPNTLNTNIEGLICGNTGLRYGSGLVFRWTGSNATEYAVDVSESSSFSGFANKVVSGSNFSITGDTVGGRWTDRFTSTPLTLAGALSLLPNKTYYWRVWASNSAGSVYDVKATANTPVNFNLPLCQTASIAPKIILPPELEASQQPSFVWNPNSQATHYGLAVSDNRDDLLSVRRLWQSFVTSNQCEPLGCIRHWNDFNWFSYGSIGPKPYSLGTGQTYYYYVWACDSSGCPLSGRVDGKFTVKGIIEKPPTNLDSTANPNLYGLYDLSWDGAVTLPAVNHYRLLLREPRTHSNFSQGAYWVKKKTPNEICTTPLPPSLRRCTVKLNVSDKDWSYVEGSSGIQNPSHPPLPFRGTTHWMVIACKSEACPLSDVVSSDTAIVVLRNAGSNGALFLSHKLSGECKADNKYDVEMSWIQSKIASSQSIFLSTTANFSPGTFKIYDVSPGEFVDGNFVVRARLRDLASGVLYSWIVRSYFNDYGYDSVPYVFDFCGQRGDYESLSSYIDQQGLGKTDPYTGLDLNYVLKQIMVHEAGYITTNKNLGLCSVGTSGEIGVMQYISQFWESASKFAGEYRAGADSGHGTLEYFVSGRDKGVPLDGCWQIPGKDTQGLAPPGRTDYFNFSYEDRFGLNIDGGAWDPYAQISTTKKMFVDYSNTVGCDNWSTYKKYVAPVAGKSC